MGGLNIMNRTQMIFLILEIMIVIGLISIIFTLKANYQEYKDFRSPCAYCMNKTGAICQYPVMQGTKPDDWDYWMNKT